MQSTRFLIHAIISIVLFWGAVAWLHTRSAAWPVMAAVTRATYPKPETKPDMVLWRYTGPRPATGEVLRVTFRQTGGAPHYDGLSGAACLGDVRTPSPREVVALTAPETADSYFKILHQDITSEWPKGRELWIGFRPTFAMWREVGSLPSTNLSVEGVETKGDLVTPLGKPYFSSVSVMVVAKEAAGPDVVFPFKVLGIAVLLLAIPALWLPRMPWLLWGALQGVLFYRALEALFPSQWLWGGFHATRLGTSWMWPGIATVQLLALPPVAAAIWRMASRLVPRRSVVAVTWVALVCVGATTLAWCFPCQPVYGDAYGSLAIPGYEYHNPFATAFYHVFRDVWFWVLELLGKLPPPTLYDIGYVGFFTALWMPVFVAGAAVLAARIGRTPTDRVMVFLLLLTMKPVLTFFRYVEVYGPVLAVNVWVIALILRGFARRRVLGASTGTFFAYLFQLGAAMALPAVLALWVKSIATRPRKVRWLAVHVTATLVLALTLWGNCLAVLFVFKHDFDPVSFARFVPAEKVPFGSFFPPAWSDRAGIPGKLSIPGFGWLHGSTGQDAEQVFLHWSKPHPTHTYLMLSWKHLSQIGGEYLFVAGPVLLVLLIVALPTLRRRWGTQMLGLLGTGVFFLISSFFLATNYPYPKDWDVFSLNALWWTVIAAWCLLRGGMPRPVARWIIVALLAYQCWDTGRWVYYNVTAEPVPEEREFIFA